MDLVFFNNNFIFENMREERERERQKIRQREK